MYIGIDSIQVNLIFFLSIFNFNAIKIITCMFIFNFLNMIRMLSLIKETFLVTV